MMTASLKNYVRQVVSIFIRLGIWIRISRTAHIDRGQCRSLSDKHPTVAILIFLGGNPRPFRSSTFQLPGHSRPLPQASRQMAARPHLTTFLLLFRGVGGPIQLPVVQLRAALTKAGFKNATTYINSGNALVRSPFSREETLDKVTAICKKKFQYDRPIFVVTAAEWAAVIKNDPFPNKVEGKHVHAVLLAERPDPTAITRLKALAVGDEDIKLVKGVCYVHTPHGFGTSKMAEKFDKGIGVVNTARNWNTVLKLMELAEELEAM